MTLVSERQAASSGPRRAALAFIFITVALDMLALGMVVPVLPNLVLNLVGGKTARAAEIYGLFGTAWALMQFIFSPMLGALSDRFGRRSVILMSNFGLGLDYIVMALAPSVRWLFLGRVISGITAASFSTAYAYIADVAPPEKRAAGFGMLSAAFGLGFVLGPAVGGLFGVINPRLPFWVAAGLSFANFMYGFFVLPESLPREQRARFEFKRANPVGSVGMLRRHRELAGLATVTFLGNVAHEALPMVFVLYAGYRYGWGTGMVSIALATVGLCSALVGAGLVQPTVNRIGERNTMLLGLVFGVLAFLIYALAPNGLLFWCAIPVGGLWGLANPPMQGIMTRRVEASEQGQLQGALGSIRGIAFMIGPVVFTSVFAAFIGKWREFHLPGAPFLLGGALLAVSLIFAWKVTNPAENKIEPVPVTVEVVDA